MRAAEQGVVLVVDDDPGVRTIVTLQLRDAGWRLVGVGDGLQALAAMGRDLPDLIILDLILPRLDGYEVLRRVRAGETACRADTSVIVLSGRSSPADRVEVLELGADDYLVKPFSPRELVARVKAVHRRPSRTETRRTEATGRVWADRTTRAVVVDGQAVHVTAREFDLLSFLLAHPHEVFTRAQLLAQVWRSSASWQTESTVTEHIRRLRGKVESDPSRPQLLRTVRGVGYQFVPLAV